MSCDVGEVTEMFVEWAELIVIVVAELILQPFRHFTLTRRAAHGDMDSKDEGKISGYSTVEQATTVSFTEMKEGVAPMPSKS